MNLDKYDQVKYTWLRYVVYFMFKHKRFRFKWFLDLFANFTSHVGYKNGKVIKKYLVSDWIKFME